MLNRTDQSKALIVVGDGVESLIFMPRHFAKMLEKRGFEVMGMKISEVY